MLIDWFTVGAQTLNFAILVWLMQRYLYRPVLDAIDAREKRIAGELADAAAKQKEASDERDEFNRKNTLLDEQRAGLLSTASDEAAAERKRLLDAAAREAEVTVDRRREALRGEATALHDAVGLRAQQEVFAIARLTLADLASASLEERICAVFLDRLRALDGDARRSLADAVAGAGAGAGAGDRAGADAAGTGSVTLRSAFGLADAQRAAIQQVVDETVATKTVLRFETAPELVAGIELRVGGQRLEWSIAHHLDALTISVDALVRKATAKPEQASTAKPEQASTAIPPAAVPARIEPAVVEVLPSVATAD